MSLTSTRDPAHTWASELPSRAVSGARVAELIDAAIEAAPECLRERVILQSIDWSAVAPSKVAMMLSSLQGAAITAVKIDASGEVLRAWPSETGDAAGDVWDGRARQLAPDCGWWRGTHYYDPELCTPFAITRLPAAIAERAVERANRCAVQATTDCVLYGEIGFNMPAAFLYDHEQGMRMLLAPKVVSADVAVTKTIRLQDPAGEHPNQLFEFDDVVRVEYLRAGTRTLEIEELSGNAAYCLQALRRATVPTCWAGLE